VLHQTDFVNASVTQLPFGDDVIPAIACFFVFSDYHDKIPLLTEIARVLGRQGRFVLADYSDADEFNNLLDEIQMRVLGRGRGMFRVAPEELAKLLGKAGLSVEESFEVEYPMKVQLEDFVNQLYLSSMGEKYREKNLSMGAWRDLFARNLHGSTVDFTRRFAVAFALKE
jgi:ubiquinone/menaquinone biosynthesis C-methylase UbiE